MAAFILTVQLGVPPTPSLDPTRFKVGDATKGVIGGSYGLADDYVWTTITDDVVSVQIDRGRSRVLDRCQPGTASVTVRNDRLDNGTAGDYDVFNDAGPYFPVLGPRTRIRVYQDFSLLFTGDVVDIATDDIAKKVTTVTFNCADPLARLNKNISYKPEAVHSPEDRFHRLLEINGVVDGEDFESGLLTYQEGIVQEGTTLDMVGDIEYSEGGLFFCATDGTYTFLADTVWDGSAVFILSDAAGAAYPYSGDTRTMGLDRIFNTVTVSSLAKNPTPVSVHDDMSAELYGERPAQETLPLATKAHRQTAAERILGTYRLPYPRFDTVTIPTARLDAAHRATICCELGTTVAVWRVPPGPISPSTITELYVVVGISHTIQPRWLETTYTLDLKP